MQLFGKQLSSKELIGNPVDFSLEERIFNTVCIIAMAAMIFEIPFNFAIGLPVPAMLCVAGLIFAILIYYLSRIKRKPALAIDIFCLMCVTLFTLNYFYNSGISGPNLILFSVVFLIVVSIIPKEKYKYWLPINAISVFLAIIFEYLDPSLAPYAYTSDLSRATDFAVTYFVVIILTFVTISYIRKNYDREHQSVIENNLAIAAQNAHIIHQKEELEHLNAEKDKLFSIVSHDIRLPLNSIQSYLEILAEVELEEQEKQEVERNLLQITRDTSEMLTNILWWSKSQLNGENIELRQLNLYDSIVKGLNVEKSIAAKKGIVLHTSVEPEWSIVADPHMFGLVLRNLVSNAIKFTPKGGEISISVTPSDDHFQIEVKDNGIGISEEQQKALFQLKAKSTYGTNHEKGIGLGLRLCKDFTLMQKGNIWFSSEQQKGSTFFISFKKFI